MVSAAEMSVERSLFEVFAEVPDPRKQSGKRHSLQSILSLTAVAMLAGMRSLYAIVQFAVDRPQLAKVLGFDRKGKRSGQALGVPCVSTLHYLFENLDIKRFEAALCQWMGQSGKEASARVLALDGKTLRGSQGHQLPGVHLLAAYAMELGSAVLQFPVDAKANEHKAALQMLKVLPLKGAIVTGDAAFAQRDLCEAIVEGGGDYFFTVKDNQPTLKEHIAQAFEDSFSPCGASQRQA